MTSNIPASWRTFKVLAPPELDSGVLEPPRLEGSFLEASQARFGFNFSVLEPPGLGCGVLKPLRAVPRCVEVRFGENQWWVGRQTTHLNGNDLMTRFGEGVPEFTPRSPAPSKRREAPSAAAAATAVAVAVVVAAAIAKFLVWSRLLGTGQFCPRDCPARF